MAVDGDYDGWMMMMMMMMMIDESDDDDDNDGDAMMNLMEDEHMAILC